MEKCSFDYKGYYNGLLKEASAMSDDKALAFYRHLCLNDSYFLGRYGLELDFMGLPYFYNRCRQVDDLEFREPGGLNNYMFLWFREGGKSSILNIIKNIQHGLADPEKSTLILSNTTPGAKMFLRSIKQYFENSKNLRSWFPDVVPDFSKHNRSWSEDSGLYLIRKTNRLDPTYKATGLVDGQPAKMHCDYLCYDDVVTKDSVETQHMISKTDEAFYLSFALGRNLEDMEGIKWVVGTTYDFADTYNKLRKSSSWRTNVIPWFYLDDKGQRIPRAHTPQKIAEIMEQMSPYAFSSQYELEPVPASDRRFNATLQHYKCEPMKHWNYVLLCDPAGEGKKSRDHNPDYTAMWVVGRDENGKEYLVDGLYDRIPLLKRINKMFGPKGFIRKWNVEWISYEKVGRDADVSVLQEYQDRMGLYCHIEPYIPQRHGQKQNRIESALMPRIANGRMLFPYKLPYQTLDGATIDLVQVIQNEMKDFPRGEHDDGLDGLAQIDAAPAHGRMSTITDPDAPLYNTLEEYRRKYERPEETTDDYSCLELI